MFDLIVNALAVFGVIVLAVIALIIVIAHENVREKRKESRGSSDADERRDG